MTDWRTFLTEEEGDRWRLDAACIGKEEVFFNHIEAINGAARQVCMTCPVTEECLAYALTIRPAFGIWAGKSPQELERYRRKARRGAA